MKELLDILAAAEGLSEARIPFAVATVVKIGGSTYRRPGARMLIDPEGRQWGTISGGCLEGEVTQQALDALKDGTRRLVPFELGEDDLMLGFGTGCDGIVHVLIEPVGAGEGESVLDLLKRCVDSRRRGVMATVIDATGALGGELGRHLLLDETGALLGALADEVLRRDVLVGMEALLDVERSRSQPYLWDSLVVDKEAGGAEILIEVVRPPVRLLVFGEGHDVRPVIDIARRMAWRVEIIGRKPVEFLAERFPEADDHRFLMHPEALDGQIAVDAFTVALVMNHMYVRDRDLMAELLKTSIPYVGVLGPKERTERMIDEVRSQGLDLTDGDLARVFGPVGLDIGTETPEEIALAALAEIQAVLHSRGGGHLRARSAPIHDTRTAVGSKVQA